MTTSGTGSAAGAAYDCASIEVLEWLDCVRHRPGMYVGDIHDGSGLHHMLEDLAGNALGQHLEGVCHRVSVTLHAGGAATVEDDGPGLPGEALETLLTTLRSFRSQQRRGWAWGLGDWMLPVANALCEALVVETCSGGRRFRQAYRRGRPVEPVTCLGAAEGTGTRVTLHPDPLVFDTTAFDARRVADMLRPIAFLNPGLDVELIEERRTGPRATRFGRGIVDWVSRLTEGQDGFLPAPLRLRGTGDGLTVDVALRWTRSASTRIRTFASHREVWSPALLWGLAQGLKTAARSAGLAPTLHAWQPERLQRGLVAIVDARGPSLEITGACGKELVLDSHRAIQRITCKRFAEHLAADDALLHALRALVTPT